MTDTWEPPSFSRATGRALLRRCPRCGQRAIFSRWLSMVERCPNCDLKFEREEGYWLGAVALNLGVTEGLFIVLLVVGIVATWPDPPWTLLLIVLVAVNLVTPILFHPYSRTLWIAMERTARKWREPDGG